MTHKFYSNHNNRSRVCAERKLIKKTKELSFKKFHIRNGFQNTNIKTSDLLKDLNLRALRKIVNDPFGLTTTYSKDIKIGYYIIEDFNELFIKNDKDFKMVTKVKPQKLTTNYISDDTSRVLRNSTSNSNKVVDLEENVIRIEYKYVETAKADDDAYSNTYTNISKIENKTNIINKYTKSVGDLQNLLIMMTLSSHSEIDKDEMKLRENYAEEKQCIDQIYMKSQPSFVTLTKPYNPGFFIGNHIADVLKIAPIGVEMCDRNLYLMKKYAVKWITFIKRKQQFDTEKRQITLNTFFEKLEKRKSNGNQVKDYTTKAKYQVKDYNTYQQRYKVQKHIIALQKAKLEEQSRIIEELKYNKILEASRQSVDNMREEVRKSYNEMDRQLKPKIKCLTNELKIPEVDETSLALQCLKVPQFLQRMEKRAREREEKHAMIRERRRQMEEERIRLKQQEELSKAEMDKEEKLRRIKDLREKRKREKIESIRRKQYTERMRALRVMADLHYEKYLMVNFGIKSFKKLLEIKRHNAEIAKSHYNFQLKKNMFLHFMWYTEDIVFERNYVAEEFHRKKVLRKYFEGFKKNHYEYVLKMQVAEDYYDYYVTKLIFSKCKEGIEILRKELEVKVQRADAYFKSNLLFKTFTCWRTLPALNALQREQEARKAKWRQKVLQVVPDYSPPDD